MILVAGSTGLLGSGICHQLTAQQKPVRALVRKTSSPEKIKSFKQGGLSIIEGDLKDPASLAMACKGCHTVISTISSTLSRQEGDSIQSVDHDGQLSLVKAATEVGVKHFIYISFRHRYAPESPLTAAKRNVEKAILESGMNYTIIQASFFMEIWLSPALGFNYPVHQARIYGDGNNPVSYISIKDVTRFATGSVDNPAVINSVIEAGGPKAISQLDAVEIFEKAGGQSFQLEFIPEEVLEQQMIEAADPLGQSFAGLMLMYARGDMMNMEETLIKIPSSLHSVADYAEAVISKETLTA